MLSEPAIWRRLKAAVSREKNFALTGVYKRFSRAGEGRSVSEAAQLAEEQSPEARPGVRHTCAIEAAGRGRRKSPDQGVRQDCNRIAAQELEVILKRSPMELGYQSTGWTLALLAAHCNDSMEETSEWFGPHAGGCTPLAGVGSDRAMRISRRALRERSARLRAMTAWRHAPLPWMKLPCACFHPCVLRGLSKERKRRSRSVAATLMGHLVLRTQPPDRAAYHQNELLSASKRISMHSCVSFAEGAEAKGLSFSSSRCSYCTTSVELARKLNITLLWLPTQCPSLNPVDSGAGSRQTLLPIGSFLGRATPSR